MSEALEPLLLDGVIDQVIGQLKAGKEAEVWLVEHAGQVVAAKVYKERQARSFKNNAGYTEGRQVRSSRTQRAIDKGSKFGQAAAEEAWKAAEADALYKLHAQGLRVPTPVMFYEGVLLMELVVGPDGAAAPRLIEAPPVDADDARAQYLDLRQQIIGMLSADLIHGDLSPYNILASANGPVIIDFPQTIAAARNNRAESYFTRDLENVRLFFLRYDPRLSECAGDAAEIWSAYLRRDLSPDYVPGGRRTERRGPAVAHTQGARHPHREPHAPRPETPRTEQGSRHAAAPRATSHARTPTAHDRHDAQVARAERPAHGGRDRGGAREPGKGHGRPDRAAPTPSPAHSATPIDPAEAELLALQEQILKQGGGERGRPFAAPAPQQHRGKRRGGGFGGGGQRPGRPPQGGSPQGGRPGTPSRPAHGGRGGPAVAATTQASHARGGAPARTAQGSHPAGAAPAPHAAGGHARGSHAGGGSHGAGGHARGPHAGGGSHGAGGHARGAHAGGGSHGAGGRSPGHAPEHGVRGGHAGGAERGGGTPRGPHGHAAPHSAGGHPRAHGAPPAGAPSQGARPGGGSPPPRGSRPHGPRRGGGAPGPIVVVKGHVRPPSPNR